MSINHHLQNILETGADSDFSIFVYDAEGNKIEKKVHKLVLKQSAYFSAMFAMKGKEANKGAVTLETITEDTMDLVLQYMYTGELDVWTTEEAVSVASAANYLQLEALKTNAIQKWQELFALINDNSQIIDVFRKLVSELDAINFKITALDEHTEKLLVAMLLASHSIKRESESFVKILIDSFGKSCPLLCTELLSDWATTKAKQKISASLVKNVNLLSFSLRLLVRVSKSPAFAPDYMLKMIQRRSETDDLPCSGAVTYTLRINKNKIVELEHQSGSVIFQVEAFNRQKDAWALLTKPKDLNVLVVIPYKSKSISWNLNVLRATFNAQTNFNDLLNEAKRITFKITLTPQKHNSTEHHYIDIN